MEPEPSRDDLWGMVLERPDGVTRADLDRFARLVEDQRRHLAHAHGVPVEAVWEAPPEPGRIRVPVRFRAAGE